MNPFLIDPRQENRLDALTKIRLQRRYGDAYWRMWNNAWQIESILRSWRNIL
jgi:hypothetical protein